MENVALAGLIVGLAGCAGSGNRLVVDPVGPLVGAHGTFLRSNTGYLEVYTATRQVNDAGTLTLQPTPYSIYRPDGHRFKGVLNAVGSSDNKPMVVPLPAGNYVVYANAEGYGQVQVPVVIVGSRLTEVHLQYGGWKDVGNLPDAEKVRLPDGRVVGRKPEPAAPSKPVL